MKIAFISDLHLKAELPENNQIFFKLLEKFSHELDELYILGDFWDYWLGDDDSNPFIDEVRSHLRNFASKVPTYFMTGNHDFALGKRFARETNTHLIKDLKVIHPDGVDILLSHGDVFCTLDLNHQKLRKIFTNNKFVIALALLFPLSFRYKIKNKMKHESHGSFNTKPIETYLVVESEILKMMNKTKTSVLIHGHTHKPATYLMEEGKVRYEIPDWQDRKAGGYILFENGEFFICEV